MHAVCSMEVDSAREETLRRRRGREREHAARLRQLETERRGYDYGESGTGLDGGLCLPTRGR